MGGIQRFARAFAAIALGAGLAGEARAGTYTFTNVADTSGGYSAFSLPVANSSGTVAFTATTGGVAKVFSGNGGAVSTVFDPTGTTLSAVKGSPSLNNLGQVGFVASGPGPFGAGTNVYRVDSPGGAATKIFDAPTYAGFTIRVASLQTADTVFFQYQGALPRVGVGTGTGGTPTFLISAGGIGGWHAAAGIGASPTGSNWVAPVNTTSGTDYTNLLLNGTALNLTYTDNPFGPPSTVALEQYSDADVSSDGTIIFSANFNALYDAIYVYKNGVLTQYMKSGIGSRPAGPYANPAINDNGVTAVLFNWGTKSIKTGIGSPTDTVISVGDALAGSTVTDLGFQKDGLSEGNQLTFTATLADGRTGVFVTQVPEPTGVAVVAVGAGALLRRRRRTRQD